MTFQALNIFNCALSFVEDPTFEEERSLSLNKAAFFIHFLAKTLRAQYSTATFGFIVTNELYRIFKTAARHVTVASNVKSSVFVLFIL